MNKNIITNKNIIFLNNVFKNLYLSKIGNINKIKNIKLDLESKESYINTYIKFLILYNDIDMHPIDTKCIVYHIIRNKEYTNYAYMYNSNIKDGNNYIVISNSFLSKDGEYKYKFISLDIINDLFKHKIIHKIYKYLTNEIKNNDFKITYSEYNNKANDIKHGKGNDILTLKIFLISWLNEIYNIIKNKQSINMNEKYNLIMFTNKDIKYFKELYNNNTTQIDTIIQLFKYYKYNIALGQKLIPFDYIQLKEYKNIIHYQWKELLINNIITKLIYNINSPCFPIYSNYILIQNIDTKLFDNPEIYKKIIDSEQIKKILDNLSIINNELIEFKQKTQKINIINDLLSRLKKIINISEQKMLMSNISLCYFSEYSGKTIYDYLNKTIDIKNINKSIGNLFTDYNIFSKYLFEIIYSLYCLNLTGIIHGDLHLNNITLKDYIGNLDDKYVVYDLNNNINNNALNYIQDKNIINETFTCTNDNYYIFKQLNCFPTIIDFSRSFILLKLINENIIEKSKNKIRKKYIKQERHRIIHELNKIFPNYINNNYHKLKFLFKDTNFNILYIYFTAYDIFIYSTNLLICIKQLSTYNNIVVNDKIINLLTNISKKAYSYLENIIDESKYTTENNIQFPNYKLIKEFFKEYEIKNIETKKIISVFNINNINTEINLKIDIKNYLNNILSNKQLDIIQKNEIINKFKHIYNYEYKNNDLAVEQIINNEFYKLKYNLSNMNLTSTDKLGFDTTSNDSKLII